MSDEEHIFGKVLLKGTRDAYNKAGNISLAPKDIKEAIHEAYSAGFMDKTNCDIKQIQADTAQAIFDELEKMETDAWMSTDEYEEYMEKYQALKARYLKPKK